MQRRGDAVSAQQRYPINEMFVTIQGEAMWAGHPSVFVRLQGCDVGCGWCDTKHTWSLDGANWVLSLNETVDAVRAMSNHNKPGDVGKPFHVVITGGEPLMHDLRPLVEVLIGLNYRVQIETSGTYDGVRELAAMGAWVTVSPKFNMPGRRVVCADALEHASEIKMPIGKAADIQQIADALLMVEKHTPLVWLQPLSQSRKATQLCVDACLNHGFMLSLQLHKFAEIP